MLCVGRHTVTGILRASGAIGQKHHTSFHRFFRAAVWAPNAVGLSLLRLVVPLLPAEAPILVPLDDTLGRHTGKHIRAAAMHHDPLRSTRAKAVFHWGHVWVVLSLLIWVPRWQKAFALPVLVRLYRTEQLCKTARQPFQKKTELAADLLALLARALPAHRFRVVADSTYANASVIKHLPPNVDFIGRAHPEAALYAPPCPHPPRRGRPRVKGERVPSPAARARSATGWRWLRVALHSRTVTVKVKVFDVLWYRVARGRLLRFVLVRGWPGHHTDDVFCSTDPALSPAEILRDYCGRWALEVTFQETKGKLGFEDPQNRTERAVERTAPLALWVYTLTVVWYLTVGRHLRTAQVPRVPWYEKTVPAFSDMLAALRRETWRHRLLAPLPLTTRERKLIDPLLDAVGYAA